MLKLVLESLAAIPKLVSAVESLSKAIERANALEFLKDSAEASRKLKNAQTKGEYREVSKKLSDLISRS